MLLTYKKPVHLKFKLNYYNLVKLEIYGLLLRRISSSRFYIHVSLVTKSSIIKLQLKYRFKIK